MATPNLWIAAVAPAGPKVGFGLAGGAKLSRSAGTGSGGWQLVDRPRTKTTTEWVDYSVYQLTMSLILDGYPAASGKPSSVEPQIATVERWETPATGSNPPLPPLLKVTGPVPQTGLQWVLTTLNWSDEAIRDRTSGVRYQQALDVVLWEYSPASAVAVGSAASPAKAAAASQTNSAIQTYTVKPGDTLESIAQALLGSWTDWTSIAKLNNLSDPDNLTVGEVLKIPASKETS